jgi:tRNA(Ile)-lysidine synthase
VIDHFGLLDKLLDRWPAGDWRNTTVVVAVSGGADSVALLRLLQMITQQSPGRGQLIAAHFNHRLRGAESDEDQAFVMDLCGELKIPLHVNQLPMNDTDTQLSSDPSDPDSWDGENQTRQLRYAFLRQIAADCGARYLATAHTADDQVETVLHRILRGTGIQGLAGIPFTREFLPGIALIRPLLDCWRVEILEFLANLQQAYRDDSSNTSRRFTRNRLRHELLPLIEREFNPRGKEALFRLAAIAQDASAVIQKEVAEFSDQSVRQISQHEVHLDCKTLADAKTYLVRELLADIWQQQNWPLREMSQEKWNELVAMTSPSSAEKKIALPGKIMAHRSGVVLVLSLIGWRAGER